MHGTDRNQILVDYENRLIPPDDYRGMYEGGFEHIANYVAYVSDSRDTPDTVATNLISRTQNALLSAIYPKDPAAVLSPGDYLPPSYDPELAQTLSLEDRLRTYPPSWTTYVKAQEIIVNKQMQQANFKDVITGAAQDAMTWPIAWLKLRWVEDDSRDPLGRYCRDSRTIRLRKYRSLYLRNEKRAFDDDSLEYADLHLLSDQFKTETIKALVSDLQLRKPVGETNAYGEEILPDPRLEELDMLQNGDELVDPDTLEQPPYFQGFELESVSPQDIRHDWTINRPEDLLRSRWIAQRVWMYPDEIRAYFTLTDEQAAELDEMVPLGDGTHVVATTSDSNKDEEREGVTPDVGDITASSTRGGQLPVWEMWDRENNTLSMWIGGSKTFLIQEEVEDAPAQFFPYHPICYNRATNVLYARSEAELLKPLQEELNGLRTHDNEARKSSYQRFLVGAGLIDSKLASSIREAEPYKMIPTNKATDIRDSIFPLPTGNYDPRLYDGSRARNDFDSTAGLSQSGLGGAQSGVTATSEAIANQSRGTQTDRRRDIIMGVIKRLVTAMVQINALRMNEANAKRLAGPGAVWVADDLDRSEVLDNFMIDIEATPNTAAERQQHRQELMEEAQIINLLGLPADRVAVYRDLIALRRRRHDFGQYLDVLQLMGPAPQGEQGGVPSQQGPSGADGGRPPNEERDDGGAIGPESVTNNRTPE